MIKLFVTMTLLLVSLTAFAATTQEENKKLVLAFMDLAIAKKQPAEAMKKYVGANYIQHNPYAASGPEAFIAFFKEYFKKYPQATMVVKRVIAEGDLVAVHVHYTNGGKDRGQAAVDILRVENGKIAEHWDVLQDVPEKGANSNSMF